MCDITYVIVDKLLPRFKDGNKEQSTLEKDNNCTNGS